jgi:hypothetical protein
MRILIASSLGILLLGGCTEKNPGNSSTPTAATPPSAHTSSATTQTIEPAVSEPPMSTDSASQSAIGENQEQGSWTGQIAVAQPVSMFNYVGAESGDFAPMRFQNNSEAGRKILAACSDGQMCEFTGVVEWLDETPPPDASAIGQIVRVDSVKRGTLATP